MLILLTSFLFAFSIFGILLVFLFNPLMLWIVYLIKGKMPVKNVISGPSVTLISVFHNAENLILDKIHNFQSLNYPSENYEVILFSDGSNDGTEDILRPFIDKKIRFLCSKSHRGKIKGINKAVQKSSGDIIIFSDVDALLGKNAIKTLVKCFEDPDVGGACGKTVIYEDLNELNKPQRAYFRFDNFIKKLESRIGSVSSNNGTLYAIRKELFQPIPPSVTDDLYVCLSIVRQKARFIYEPNAKAHIKSPSRSSFHEIQRRRRIVCSSFRGIFSMKALLNPFRYGTFSVSFLINKIVKRGLVIYLMVMFITSVILSFFHPLFNVLLLLQVLFYSLAFFYRVLNRYTPRSHVLLKIASLAYYLCLGSYGTLLALFDFLRGKKIIKWEPFHGD